MKFIVYLLILFPTFIFSQLHQDTITIENENQRFVTAKSGLRLRDSYNLNSKVITVVPYQSSVVIEDRQWDYISIEDVYGYWAKINSNGKKGWTFSGYLSSDIIPNKNIKHWNKSKELYFIHYAINENNSCSILFTNEGCKIIVYDKNNKLVRTYSDPIGTSGWKDDKIILSSTSADGGGGGFSQKIWDPKNNLTLSYYFSGFINNAMDIPESGAEMTNLVCIDELCYYLENNEKTKNGYLFIESQNKERRFIKKISYKKKIELHSKNRKFYIIIDGIEYKL